MVKNNMENAIYFCENIFFSLLFGAYSLRQNCVKSEKEKTAKLHHSETLTPSEHLEKFQAGPKLYISKAKFLYIWPMGCGKTEEIHGSISTDW